MRFALLYKPGTHTSQVGLDYKAYELKDGGQMDGSLSSHRKVMFIFSSRMYVMKQG